MSGSRPISRGQLIEILQVAITAPSGDNCQPWRFALRADGFDLLFQPQLGKSLLDVKDLASHMAAGAFLELARLRAGELGYEAIWRLAPDAHSPLLWARVWFRSDPVIADPLAGAVTRRHANRYRFDGSPLSKGEQEQLVAQARASTRIHLLVERAQIEVVARIAGVAERCRSEIRSAHDELHRWLRWSQHDAETTRDGLDVRTLGLGFAERKFLAACRPWTRMRWALRLGAARATGAYSRRLVASSSAVALIAGPGPTPTQCTELGGVMQRVWLEATRLGLQASPVMAFPLLWLRVEISSGEGLTPEQREALRVCRDQLSSLLRSDPGGQVFFMLRIGRAPEAGVRALRRDVETSITRG